MSFWKDKRVLVTGATGFIGGHVAKLLVESGADAVCLQRDGIRANALDLLEIRKRVSIVTGQLEDYSLLERVLNEYEIQAVFHLAAQAIVGTANRSPLSTFEANIRGTYNLLEACRVSKLVSSVIVASSDKAYGTHEQLPYRETDALNGLFPYDASKVCTDVLSRSFAHSFKLPVVVTRFANVYGPGDTNFSRIIPGTIKACLQGEQPIIRSDGTPIREFIYVEDVATGYLTLAERAREFAGEAFNFGTGEQVQMLDLVNKVISLSGTQVEPRVMLSRKIDGEIDAQYLSAEKAENLLGWRATTSLDKGLKDTISWYRERSSMFW